MPKYNNDNAKSAKAYHHGNLRAELIRSGLALLESQGVAAFSLREVARGAGVSPSAPYRHFPDRDALLGAMAAEGYQKARGLLGDQAAGSAVALVRFGRDHPALWQLMMAQRSAGGDLLEEARGEFLAELVGVVERSAGEPDPELAIRKAVALWGQVLGMVQLKASGALGLLDDALLPAIGDLADILVNRRRLGAADARPPES
jgi:AcrR family transcriptional regulator